jgi:hypothetical protein
MAALDKEVRDGVRYVFVDEQHHPARARRHGLGSLFSPLPLVLYRSAHVFRPQMWILL